MQLVINIDDDLYKSIISHRCKLKFQQKCDYEDLKNAIEDGTPLPKGHGAIKDISQIEIPMCEDRTYEKWVQVAINSAPTIIEADRSEES